MTAYDTNKSEDVAHPRLELPRLTQPGSDGPIEVQERALRGRVLEIVGVGHVEGFCNQLEGSLTPKVERLGKADVPGEVGVVPADGVPLEDVAVGADAILGGVARIGA